MAADSMLALKPAHSASGETSDKKRQFAGDLPFDEIVAGVLATLGPPLYVCQDCRERTTGSPSAAARAARSTATWSSSSLRSCATTGSRASFPSDCR